jgi:hypothetical protein
MTDKKVKNGIKLIKYMKKRENKLAKWISRK